MVRVRRPSVIQSWTPTFRISLDVDSILLFFSMPPPLSFYILLVLFRVCSYPIVPVRFDAFVRVYTHALPSPQPGRTVR